MSEVECRAGAIAEMLAALGVTVRSDLFGALPLLQGEALVRLRPGFPDEPVAAYEE